ncbi:MAG: 50S ribosomal protein L9 [Planctomycetes bacterium RBG_16_64_10]|nr:MAG: 50S ribosomal protein L9 [Planctomycetes bacterium RBG_16_64_10]
MPKTRSKQRPAKRRPPQQRNKRLPKGPNGGIQLLLIHSVEHLGAQGEVVEVRPGYAKNYLIPHGLATIATDHHQRMVEKHRARLQAIEKARVDRLRDFATALSKQSITVEANANDEGHLYGSVGATEIAAALKAQDLSVSPDQVKLEGPLKELGLYTVAIRVAPEIQAELKVWVVPVVAGGAEASSRKDSASS